MSGIGVKVSKQWCRSVGAGVAVKQGGAFGGRNQAGAFDMREMFIVANEWKGYWNINIILNININMDEFNIDDLATDGASLITVSSVKKHKLPKQEVPVASGVLAHKPKVKFVETGDDNLFAQANELSEIMKMKTKNMSEADIFELQFRMSSTLQRWQAVFSFPVEPKPVQAKLI